MRTLNRKVGNTLRKTEPVYDPYKNSLDNILDSNIDDIVASTIDTNPCLLRQKTSATQLRMPFDVLLPLGLFNEAESGGDKNSSLSAKRNSSPILLPSIVLKKPSNLFFSPFGNYNKLRKVKPRAAFTSWGLGDLDNITDQSGFQNTSAVSKNNSDGIKNSWQNQMQKSLSVIREQKRDVKSDVS